MLCNAPPRPEGISHYEITLNNYTYKLTSKQNIWLEALEGNICALQAVLSSLSHKIFCTEED